LFTAFDFDVRLISWVGVGHRVRIDVEAEKKAHYCEQFEEHFDNYFEQSWIMKRVRNAAATDKFSHALSINAVQSRIIYIGG
jgi:hypothetical protein